MNPHDMQDVEEALGIVWNAAQKAKSTAAGAAPAGPVIETLKRGVRSTIVDELVSRGMVTLCGADILLTPEGERIGRDVTRRHRLTERLLADVLQVKGDDIDATACKIEHIISAGIADSICTLLGHPRACPHGSPIPPGDCCARLQANAEPVVVPLDALPVGASAVVAYLVTGSHPHIHKLLSLGIVPGTPIHLHQRSPSFVVTVNETQIALDAAVARQIYTRPG